MCWRPSLRSSATTRSTAGPGFAFEDLPKLFGGVGFRVETLDQLKAALKDGAAAMEKGQSVVINAILSE